MVHLQPIHPHTMILTSFSSPAIPEIEESLWNSSRWRWCSAAHCRLCGNRSNPGSSQSSQSSRYSSSLYQLMRPLSELPVMSWLVASCPGHEAESLVETMQARKIFQKIHHQSTRPEKKNDNQWRVAPNHDRNWLSHRIEILWPCYTNVIELTHQALQYFDIVSQFLKVFVKILTAHFLGSVPWCHRHRTTTTLSPSRKN